MLTVQGKDEKERSSKRNDRLGGEEELVTAGTSEVAEPVPPLNPWMKFR